MYEGLCQCCRNRCVFSVLRLFQKTKKDDLDSDEGMQNQQKAWSPNGNGNGAAAYRNGYAIASHSVCTVL